MIDQFIGIDPAPKNAGVAILFRKYPKELLLLHGAWDDSMFKYIKEQIDLYGTMRTKVFFEDVVWFHKGGAKTLENHIFIKEHRAILRYVYGQDCIWSPYPAEWKKHFGFKKQKPTLINLLTLLEDRGIEKLNGKAVDKLHKTHQDIIDACFILFHGVDTYNAILKSDRR